MNYAVGMQGDIVLMRHQHDGIAILMEAREKRLELRPTAEGIVAARIERVRTGER